MAAVNHQELPRRSVLQRGLALAQQLKDTANILLFLGNGYLFFGILGGIGIPGLILYYLRWKLLRRTGDPTATMVLWALSLLHELLCLIMFYCDHPHSSGGEMSTPLEHWEPLYLLGVVICCGGLADLLINQPAAETVE
ncbi:hypothetical protein Q5H93_17495 [Hymenobacter sp. ASUV-10]|uniref:Uncharacterized protein n=1 Tax=Hymenobacter aranciens TaxID=3063996 RepID=A0ABT9BE44_9BACT|nr:hypothetical protein [Hymenobacter sp. ASUV-10]MDO7876543.1 hypothetical protein [Hymenobacter sp. ASUV-10]